MMQLKQIPEDFKVLEIPLIKLSNRGRFSICELTKKDFNTECAIGEIAKQLSIPRKHIGYAGTKDKRAITTQLISIVSSESKINNFKHQDISLKYLGKHDEPLSLGLLKGNKFKIVVRDLSGEEIIREKKFVNFFHNQRFSKNNVLVGKFLLKKDYSSAVSVLINDSSFGYKIKSHLEKSINDFVGALKTIPKKILSLYIHAYQSHLWNIVVEELLNKDALPKEVPIVGFSDFDCDSVTRKVINDVMLKEGVSQLDFLNRDIQTLCVEGTYRNTLCSVSNLVVGDFLVDELNGGRRKVLIEFELGKGEYATSVIDQLFS